MKCCLKTMAETAGPTPHRRQHLSLPRPPPHLSPGSSAIASAHYSAKTEVEISAFQVAQQRNKDTKRPVSLTRQSDTCPADWAWIVL